MSTNYIFCPFCGGSTWTTDKTREAMGGRLESYKCGECQKFIYIEHLKRGQLLSPSGLIFIERKPYQIEALIGKYQVIVYCAQNATHFLDFQENKVILALGYVVKFNWYAREEVLLDKIKTYLVFS
jgi:hypothetical protein